MAINPPPLLVNFTSCDELCDAVSGFTTPDQIADIRSLSARGLPPAVSARVLAIMFGISARFVGAIVRRPRKYYRAFAIRKGKKLRRIDAPRVALKIVQKWLATHIAASTAFPSYVYGFVAGRSYIDAAAAHCRKDWIVSVDIQDFFPSISQSQVVVALGTLGYSEHAANLIAGLCCLDQRLPQGSPASPVLSNLVFARTDQKVCEICADKGITYTRYADDLVFSGHGETPADFIQGMSATLAADGWVLAERKTRWSYRPSRLKVHGLLVEGDNPKLTRGYRNKIRAYVHMLESGKVKESDVARLRGHVSLAMYVERGRQGGERST